MSIVFKSYTDEAAEGRVISKGNTNAVAAAAPDVAVTKSIVTLPIVRSGTTNTYFWGFESTQNWVDPTIV